MFFFGVLRCSLHLLFQIFRALFIEIRNGIGLILCLCVIVRLAEAECALDPCIPRLVGLFFFCGVIAGRYIVQIEHLVVRAARRLAAGACPKQQADY